MQRHEKVKIELSPERELNFQDPGASQKAQKNIVFRDPLRERSWDPSWNHLFPILIPFWFPLGAPLRAQNASEKHSKKRPQKETKNIQKLT